MRTKRFGRFRRSLYILLSSFALITLAFASIYLINIYNINRSYYEEENTEGNVALRKFPYPYKAAMTICSDIDGTTTKEEFLEIQRFLNTKEKTRIGKGIGLEIGNSFMMYAPPTCAFSYFSGNPGDKEIIGKFIKAGYIDVMHSYGEKPDFSREDAVKALEELERNGCKVDVWVDHSKMVDNLGDDVTFGSGDHQNSLAYHSDLTKDYGIKFVWLGRVTMVVGQSTPITIRMFTSIYDPDHPIRSLINITKEFAKNVLGVFGDKKYSMHKSYELVRMTKLDDGRKAYEFMRFDNYWEGVATGATCKSLAYVISKRTLEILKEIGGYAIVYTHLGMNSDCSNLIPNETQAALRNLAREYEAGNIYVTTTSKLLKYYVSHKYLNWSYKIIDDEIIVTIHNVEDPVSGLFVPTVQDLQGITFYVPDKSKARIYIGDKEITNTQKKPADYTGRESITIALRE